MPQIPPIDLSTCHLSDSAKFYVAMDPGILPLYSGARIKGAKVQTVQVPPGDNTSLFAAIDQGRPGNVLVVNGNGYTGRSLWGAIMSFAAMQNGLGGVVIDGLVRDKSDIEQLNFPVFARGVTPVSPRPRREGSIGKQIMCGGVNVAPGDYVFADDDGVVCVPETYAEQVTKAAWQRAEKEDGMFNALANGTSLSSLVLGSAEG